MVVVKGGETTVDVSAIMAAVEALKYPKFYYANVDFEDDTKFTTEGIKRTLICYYTPTENVPVPVAAIAGEVSGLEVGSYTLNNMVVKGIDPLELSEHSFFQQAIV